MALYNKTGSISKLKSSPEVRWLSQLEDVSGTQVHTPFLIDIATKAGTNINKRVDRIRDLVGSTERHFTPVVIQFIINIDTNGITEL